ncbi:23S rRNA (guanine(745)-N(1))-methyltransferase [Pseudoalteromonas luteoviolacea]|uniref:23S rRNA (guanine(745)-N(1))-methyltransferase n=1 Tax=Pseudoalteromonas luteoviolacea TaxID=43657 RepID=UPI001B37F466|nr:23S rRNA (guanine(745)-N(1))-methyltransferase [Pseudoalteromonas luteoviolacea]MBQ4835921.1 23S rRNA (guanine(745)-N(1))-methyltransferase [Pseudoalteromonas luteoviolacea]
MTLDYRCPICSEQLNQTNNTLSCKNRHQFDFAKEGYVNLLPVQFKRSKNPGDNLDMVQARRAFFATNHYTFLQQSLAELIAKKSPKMVVDLGCGEGFYTQAVAAALPDSTSVYGLDISKPAVKFAAKRYRKPHFSVASSKDAPFKEAQTDIVLSIFAPVFSHESKRLLQPDGTLVVVGPGPKHLYELKQKIYDDVRLHDAPPCPEGFEVIEQTLVEERQSVAIDVVENLIKMTPFAWKFKASHFEELAQNTTHQITFSFLITQYKKQSS